MTTTWPLTNTVGRKVNINGLTACYLMTETVYVMLFENWNSFVSTFSRHSKLFNNFRLKMEGKLALFEVANAKWQESGTANIRWKMMRSTAKTFRNSKQSETTWIFDVRLLLLFECAKTKYFTLFSSNIFSLKNIQLFSQRANLVAQEQYRPPTKKVLSNCLVLPAVLQKLKSC